MPTETIDDVLARALDAYEALGSLGEEVEDEWTYVTELEADWRARLTEVADGQAGEPVSTLAGDGVDRLIEEIGLITDPHRAIDWLSTFPQLVLLAVGEES